MAPKNLDELDRTIIVALEHDGRRAFREIGRELGVPESTVRSRVKRLIEEDYIRITAVGNLLNLGVDVVGVTLLKVQPGMSRRVANVVADYPNVRFVGTSFGNADVIIQTLHTDIRDLHRFVSETLPEAAPEIVSTETFQLADVVKSSWEWGEWFDHESIHRAAAERSQASSFARTLVATTCFDPKVVSERLGHTNVAFTQTIYQHLYDEQRSQAAIGLAQMLS